MPTKKINIRNLSLEDLIDKLIALGEKKFRAKQIYEWIWKKGVREFSEMKNISKKIIEALEEHYFLDVLKISDLQKSKDGTIKVAFTSFDGHVTEGVLIPTETRVTACISSQVGCRGACKFCATGRLKLMRNLSPGEIYDQVLLLTALSDEHYSINLSNIVFMGMGEPLMNYNNVLKSIDKITSEEGLAMSPQRITVSTSGVPKMIKKLADDEVKFNLAVSLHSAIQETREQIMPFAKKFTLTDLKESLEYWYEKTNRRITYEYVVWEGINDSITDINALVKFCRYVPSKVNLIEYNPIDDGEFRQASSQVTNNYIAALEKSRIPVTVRRSRGKDIDAACGQLANKQ